jgi:hypothetical protein
MPTGYVYELYSDEGEKTYIGSTTENLEKRLKGHYAQVKSFRNGTVKTVCSSIEMIEMYKNVMIRQLEEVEFIDKDDTLLQQEEQKWIDMSKSCINKFRAYVPDDWFKEQRKELYEKNKDEWKENQLVKYYENHEENKQKLRENYYKHRDKIRQYQKEYYQLKKERIKQTDMKVKCECGVELMESNMYLHLKSLKHQKWLSLNCD